MTMYPKVDFVITARPSWSRVKNLILEFVKLEGNSSARITLLGSAISDRYGDIRNQIPLGIELKVFDTFNGNENLFSVVKTSIDGARSLSQNWQSNPSGSVLVIADRTETLGVSLAASTMQIPLIHLQGGEESGSIDNKIRAANSKLADLHLTTNELSANNLIKIGEQISNIEIIGCPSVDLAFERLHLGTPPKPYSELYGGVGTNFSSNQDYGIIMFHPDTLNLSESNLWIDNIFEMANDSELNWFWFWPNIDYGGESLAKKLRAKRENTKVDNIRFLKNIKPEEFMDLAIQSKLIVGNSSFGIREANSLGLPALNVGTRQNNRQRGNNVFDVKAPANLKEIVLKLSNTRFPTSYLYGNGDAAKKGAIILSKWTPALKG